MKMSLKIVKKPALSLDMLLVSTLQSDINKIKLKLHFKLCHDINKIFN